MSKHTHHPLLWISLALLAFWQFGGGLPDALQAQSPRPDSARQSSIPSLLGGPGDVIAVPPGLTRPTGRAQLNGMIVAADTGKPIVGALVIVTLWQPYDWQYRSTTDTGGWYRFADLPTGTYGMMVGKTGYLVGAAVRGNIELPLTPTMRQLRGLAVTEDQPTRVDIKMVHAGAGSGVVRDER